MGRLTKQLYEIAIISATVGGFCYVALGVFAWMLAYSPILFGIGLALFGVALGLNHLLERYDGPTRHTTS